MSELMKQIYYALEIAVMGDVPITLTVDQLKELIAEIDRLKKENAELGADKIHLIQAEMDGGDRWHYTAHDIGYKDLAKKCKALEADYLVSNRELLILQAEIVRLRKERRWIPVSERLPNRDGFYLILENVNQVAGYYHWCKQFGWNTDGGRIHIQTVTHWMPLPEPPEDE